MIPLYYQPSDRTWFHQESIHQITWGKDKKVIPYSGGNVETMLPFFISQNNGRLSPIVGILAGNSKSKTTFIGNAPSFIRLQKELEKRGSLCVVFTPASFGLEGVNGFYYLVKLGKWIRIKTPLPDIVYNRIPYRKMEDDKGFSNLMQMLKQKNIPHFNPSFFSKWKVYQSLLKNPKLKRHLPDTTLYSSSSLKSMLEQYKCIYLKDDKGHKGKGLFRIAKHKNGYSLGSVSNYQQFSSLSKLEYYLNPIVEKDTYLLQEAILADTFDSKRYDIRVLVHLSKENQFQISGIGIRLSGKKDITTHVPNGGTILTYSFVQSRINKDILSNMVKEVGKQLSEDLKEMIGEFSIDIGKTLSDGYYIFEVNSKPMVFDEPDIKKEGLKNLAELLISKACEY
jgi:hypothetical protein